ncbi:hypothetical protein ACFLSE_06200 [Bacteroidota bacterium]
MKRKDLITILLIVICIFLFLGLTGTITSGYHFVDDHEIIRIKADFESMNLFEITKKWIKDDLNIRFRPLYYFLRIVQTRLFGSNFFIWSVCTGLLACIAMVAFYMAMRNFQFTVEESILFLVISFIGQQMDVWWRLGPNETIGVVFLALSFFFMSRNCNKIQKVNNLFFVIFLILSSFCKESFIIIIPGVIFFKILKERTIQKWSIRETVIKNLYLIIPIIIMFVELYIIVFYVGTNKIGYAGLDSSFLNTLNGVKNIIFNFISFKLVLGSILIIILIAYLTYKKLYDFKLIILPALLCILIVLPNLVLYAKSGLWGRYLIPSSIGVAFIIISVIKALDEKLIWIKRLAIIGLFVFFIPLFKDSVKAAKTFSKEGRNIAILVQKIRENYKEDSKLLMVVDPIAYYEQSYSFKTYLELEYNINLFGYAINNSPDEEFSESQTKGWYQYFNGRTVENMDSIPDLIIFLDKDLVNDFFEISDYKLYDYENVIHKNPLYALLNNKTN